MTKHELNSPPPQLRPEAPGVAGQSSRLGLAGPSWLFAGLFWLYAASRNSYQAEWLALFGTGFILIALIFFKKEQIPRTLFKTYGWMWGLGLGELFLLFLFSRSLITGNGLVEFLLLSGPIFAAFVLSKKYFLGYDQKLGVLCIAVLLSALLAESCDLAGMRDFLLKEALYIFWVAVLWVLLGPKKFNGVRGEEC
ncbi:MAG: hypothetical protein RRB13_03070 [bacterium]|nr:hypothetical protein [bacterium]